MVKPAAYLPNPKNGQTSVFRHGVQPPERLWQLGNEHLAEGRSLHGAGILTAKDVRDASLNVQAEEPPHFHANIINWPNFPDDPEESKAKQKKAAIILASRSKLVLRNDPG